MAKPIFTHLTEKLIATFWSRVSKKCPDECWPWTGTKGGAGYGRIKMADGTWRIASRVSLTIALGREIAPAMMACHKCDNPPCCNPKHLYEGTSAQNSADAVSRDRTHKWNGERIGDGNPKAKLTSEDVMRIRELSLDPSHNRRTIAKIYGVSRFAIIDIMKGRTWTGV